MAKAVILIALGYLPLRAVHPALSPTDICTWLRALYAGCSTANKNGVLTSFMNTRYTSSKYM